MNAILIPVKDLDQAKTRQATCLTRQQRKRLVLAMLTDVARQLDRLQPWAQIVLVTPDQEVTGFGLDRGWDVILEKQGCSESLSVDRASHLLENRGITHLLRIPADIPLLRASDLRELLETELKSPAAIAVPSRDGSGTNALLRTPPTAFPSRFGKQSLKLHQQEARLHGVDLRIVENRDISLDLDTDQDLLQFLKEGNPQLASHQLVSSWQH